MLTSGEKSASIKNMNQTTAHTKIMLTDLMKGPDGWGNAQGKEVGALLEEFIIRHPATEIFLLSFKGVRRTDASFSREGIVEIARRFRAKKALAIIDLEDDDLIENLDMAATKKEYPVFLWKGESCRLLGPEPTKGNKELLDYLMKESEITAASAAAAFDLKLTNASTKLKALWESGYIMRREDLAPSGGIEFIYYRIQ